MTRQFIPPRWVAVPSELIVGPKRLPDVLLATYVVILYFAWQNDYRFTEASIKDISVIRGLGYRTVWDHLRRLEELGVISLEGGRGKPRRIMLHIRPEVRTASPVSQPAQPGDQLSRPEDMKSVAESQKDQQSNRISSHLDNKKRKENDNESSSFLKFSSPSEKQAYQLLRFEGVHEPACSDLARKCRLADIEAWIAEINTRGARIRDRAGFLVSKLGGGEKPPPKTGSTEERYRYIRGEYQLYIEH